MNNEMTGAEIVLKSLAEQGVEVVFGYPGGAVYLSMTHSLNRIQLNMFWLGKREVLFMQLKVMQDLLVKLALF